MSSKLLIFCTLLLNLHYAQSTITIPKITDDDFLKMAADNDYIIVLFTRENCKPCEVMENELLAVHDQLQDALDTIIAKVYDSKLVRVYNPTKEPTLVFFRHGVPLLYVGEVDHELILHNFVENRDPTVKELTDENFEHLTQATTGSTTGDWLIMFYSKTCPTSRGLSATWEAVGAALSTKMNVARISIESPGFYTSQRFDISHTPTFVLLHYGYVYMYKSDKLDIDSLLTFARNFRQMPSKKIPLPLGPMDSFLNTVTEFLEVNDWFLETGLLGMILGLIGAIFVKCIDRKVKSEGEDEEEEAESEPEHEKEN